MGTSLKERLRRQMKPRLVASNPAPPEPSDLVRRLRRLHLKPRPSGPEGDRESDRESRTSPRPTVVRPLRRTDPNRPLTEPPEVTWTEVERAGTACRQGQVELPATHVHGAIPIADVLRLDGRAAVLLSGDAALASFDPTEAFFFDLETTGLLGGSMAFLAGGIEVRDDGSAMLHQYMLRDPTEEAAALTLLAEQLAAKRFLVSFNGKSFDRNVLADRFTMNRMDPDRVLEMPHLDLLHPARRLFRRSLGGCSLSVLEERRLGVHRHESEVRGAEVPERWFDFLRTGREQLLAPVIDHNAIDLLSLLTLGAHLVACVEAPGAAIPEPRALVAAAKLLLERGETDRGEDVLKILVRGTDDDPATYAALGLLAEHLRKGERWGEALPLWARMRRIAGIADVEPWVAAAIALEWRVDRPEDALEIVEDALERMEYAGETRTPEYDDLEHRRARLRSKVDGGRRADPAPSRRPGRGGSDAPVRTPGIGG